MTEKQEDEILKEIKQEQHPIEDDETLKGYIKDAEFDINEHAGTEIDYSKDLRARKLLKNYIMYDRYKRLAEFKQLYGGEYFYVQSKYYNENTDL